MHSVGIHSAMAIKRQRKRRDEQKGREKDAIARKVLRAAKHFILQQDP